jgi:orotate phosphoribosyltransferase
MDAKKIAEILLKTNAVKINVKNPFTYTSGLKSPIYTDNRILISSPPERGMIVDGYLKLIEERGLKPDYIAGTATAGIPWAAFVAQKMNLPMIYVRSKPKGHGAGKQIEGDLEENKSVLIIEDLISTGGSALNSVNAIRNEGKCIVHDVLAIFSYGLEKAEESFRDASVALSTLTDIDVLIKVAHEKEQIEQSDIEAILRFKKDPDNWM